MLLAEGVRAGRHSPADTPGAVMRLAGSAGVHFFSKLHT